MINITNIGNGIKIDLGDGTKYTLPKSIIIATQSDDSDSVNIKFKGSRKTIVSFIYTNVTNPSSTSSKSLITALNTLFY